jgi:hypothetical protein
MTTRSAGAILILGGILLCAYGENTTASAGEYQVRSDARRFDIHDRDRSMPIWFGVSGLSIGLTFLFVPRRDEL